MLNLYKFGPKHNQKRYFHLDRQFIKKYDKLKPCFGFNGLGELVYYRTYSRLKPNGMRETWKDTIERVINGCFTIQENHLKKINSKFDSKTLQKDAQLMFER